MKLSPAASYRRILDLAIKDLQQIVRDRKSFLFLLIMPIVFTLLFGFAFGGSSSDDPRLPVSLLDEDGSAMSGHLVAMLQNSQVIRIEGTGVPEAMLLEQVAREDIAAGVLIPAGYGASLLAGEAQPVTVIGGGQTGFTIEDDIQAAAARLRSAVEAATLSAEMAEEQGLLPVESSREAAFGAAFNTALTAWESPPVSIAHDQSSAKADQETGANTMRGMVFAHASPGMMAQFAIAGLIGAAGILVVEKKTQSLQRLLTTNMSRAQILTGHFLAMFVMIFLQLTVLILFGQIFLDLPYLSQPSATLLLTTVTAIFTASLGMLIGVVSKSEEQVIVLSLVPMFILSALGGAWVPLEFTPQTFSRVASLTPLAFIIGGYKDILVRGQGLEALGPALLALLFYAAFVLGMAVWRFRAT